MAKRKTSIPRSCLTCGNTFRATPFELSKGKGKYCGAACYHQRPRPNLQERSEAKVKRTNTCWLWTGGTDKNGYGLLAIKGWRSNGRAHKISYEFAYGPVPEGLCVLHRCDNPPCVRPDHLFVGTHADNAADRVLKGRTKGAFAKGTAHPQAILTENDVREIRRLCAAGVKQIALARRFRIDPSSISNIVQRKHWSHVD